MAREPVLTNLTTPPEAVSGQAHCENFVDGSEQQAFFQAVEQHAAEMRPESAPIASSAYRRVVHWLGYLAIAVLAVASILLAVSFVRGDWQL